MKQIIMKHKECLLILALIVCLGLWLGGCGGTSGSSSTPTGTSTITTTGYTVPTKVSAVPTSESASGQTLSSLNLSLKGKLKTLSNLTASAATDPGTDYSNAQTSKYVEEHTLEQFAIIEQVLGALNQTHYADAGNINQGPYLAMVAWEDKQDGRDIKKLEPWVIDSQQIVENGQNVLRARAWIEEEDQGQISHIKAEFKVYAPATKKADGSYADYGVWTMNVKFDETGNDFFAASASVASDGKSIIKVHEAFPEGMPGAPMEMLAEMKAIMYVSDTEGYGKVYYPDFESLFGPDADPDITELPHIEAQYAYNADYLAVQQGEGDVQYKNRNLVTEMVHRYGVYNNETGQDVMKTKSFGFPIRYTSNGITKHAYYGAWQGRHQIWTHGQGETIPEGTEVVREDLPPGQTETYTVGETFAGTLTKRTLISASVEDIKDIPVEIWVNEDYNMFYTDHDTDGDLEWCYCTQMDWGSGPPTCTGDLNDFDETIGFESLIVGANDDRKFVYIGRYDQIEGNKQYVYEAASAENDGAGFYEADEVDGRLTVHTPRVKLVPEDGMDMWITIGGSLYVEYKGAGTGWVEKEVVGFNTMTWTPEFNEDGDKPYTLPLDRELYVNMQGANYIVRRTGVGEYTTQLELQTAANPSNATSIVQAGTVFKDQWNPDGNSTYEFITDDSDDNYLMLVYYTIGDNDKDANGDPNEGVSIGGVVPNNIWGLEAYVNDQTTGTMFNWEYSNSGSGWGTVTYLKNTNGSYKLVDDPMRFDTITATNAAGEQKTLALQYDGWMMGLPMMYDELSKNNWLMTDEIADKIINLPEGTEVTDSSTGTAYLLKPLEVSQFLNLVTDTTGLTLPDISLADSVDLNTVPDFVEHGMGAKPDVTTVKYSEGNLVQ